MTKQNIATILAVFFAGASVTSSVLGLLWERDRLRVAVAEADAACDAEVAQAKRHADDSQDVACFDLLTVLPGQPGRNRVGIIVSGVSAEAVLARCAVTP